MLSNGTPLQCSCLENPRDGGAWWAAVYGVAQSRTGLKQRSSSSSIYTYPLPLEPLSLPLPPSYPSLSTQSTRLSALCCIAIYFTHGNVYIFHATFSIQPTLCLPPCVHPLLEVATVEKNAESEIFFFFSLYNIVLVLPHINMNPPRVYT